MGKVGKVGKEGKKSCPEYDKVSTRGGLRDTLSNQGQDFFPSFPFQQSPPISTHITFSLHLLIYYGKEIIKSKTKKCV